MAKRTKSKISLGVILLILAVLIVLMLAFTPQGARAVQFVRSKYLPASDVSYTGQSGDDGHCHTYVPNPSGNWVTDIAGDPPHAHKFANGVDVEMIDGSGATMSQTHQHPTVDVSSLMISREEPPSAAPPSS